MMRPRSQSLFLGDIDRNVSVPEQTLPQIGKRKAVFVDRDGTINEERGYIIDPQEIQLAPLAAISLASLNRQGIPVIVITNQAAIGKGSLTVEMFEKINDKLWNDLQAVDAHYDALYYCPHNPEITTDCPCRKPKPGLILQAAKDLDLDLQASFMVGDKLADITAGRLSRCKTILLLSGHGDRQEKLHFSATEAAPDFICDTLAEAIDWILPQILANNDL